jgi:hypothetical protein
MSKTDRRRHERFRAALQVRYGTVSCDHVGPAENISLSGLCIRTNQVFPTGTRIRMQIDFPDRTVHHTGEVMWAIKVPEHDMGTMMCGMGIQFIAPGAAWAEFFSDWRQGRDSE